VIVFIYIQLYVQLYHLICQTVTLSNQLLHLLCSFVCLTALYYINKITGVTRESDTPGKGGPQKCNGNGRKTAAYLVEELNGWIYLFPDAARPGAIEQYSDPFVIPEAISPNFRYVEVCRCLTPFLLTFFSFFGLVSMHVNYLHHTHQC
jgi:hypothetical protein